MHEMENTLSINVDAHLSQKMVDNLTNELI